MTPEEEMQRLAEEEEKLTDLIKNADAGYGFPEQEKKDSIFKFFREIWKSDDSRKIANLTDQELGKVRRGVRHYLDIADYAEVRKLPKVARYLQDKAETILATSMSRRGFFLQTTVTQIKKEQKLGAPLIQKKPWFSLGKKQEEQQNEPI